MTADHVLRFARDLAAALGRAVTPDDRIAVAVSGGPDSMAMLALASVAFPDRVIAATVDHGLRAESAHEAAMVAQWCATNAVPHTTLTLAVPLAKSGIQANARIARYDTLARWALGQDAAMLATAHHADDQAETFLMRAVRGTGPSGLAGIRARRDIVVRDHLPGFPKDGVVAAYDQWSVTLVRPLLDWRRAELRAIVADRGVSFVDDPSNLDGTFERVQVRALLAESPWLDAAQLARSAAHAAEASAALAEHSRWLWESRKVVPTGVDDPDFESWIDVAGLPRELKRRLARVAIQDVRLLLGIFRPAFDDATNIESLLDALEAGKSATQGGVMASAKRDIWRFREEPPRR